jgi:hypothetical protein
MSGRQPRKVVVLVDRAGRGGAVECQSGGFECSSSLRVSAFYRVGDEVALGVGRLLIGHHFWRMVLWMQSSFPLSECPGSCSSHSRRGFFPSAVALVQLVWWSGSPLVVYVWLVSICDLRCAVGKGGRGPVVLVFGWALARLYRFSPGFPLINWASSS